MSGKRSKLVSPYHNCGRCSCRRHLSELKWESGVLVCSTGDCQDTAVVGSREAAIAKILQAVAISTEGQPDIKLLMPVIANTADDDISF